MDFMNKKLKSDLINFFNNNILSYFKKPLRVVELVISLLLSFVVLFFVKTSFVQHMYKGLIANIHSLILFYIVYRFGIFGLILILTYSAYNLPSLLIGYFIQPQIGLLIGTLQNIVILITSVFLSVLSVQQERSKKKLENLAVIDGLTGIFNQRYFHVSIDEELKLAEKKTGMVGLMLIDIDNFKLYNDVFGHEYGDIILRNTANLLKELIIDNEALCRCGGDEFGIILPDTNIKYLEQRANEIQREFNALKTSFFEKESGEKVTLSIGLSQFPDMANNKNQLIYQADMALYHAKNLGKDKVHFYQDVILQIRKTISSDHQQLIGVFRGLLGTISAKDKYTLGHSERVSTYAVMIGQSLGMDVKDISILQYAGLLHDIGKIEIPKSILNKVEPLTEDEIKVINKHSEYSANILEILEGMTQLIDCVRHHHERFDGTGYPDGLKGEEISLYARILCIADSFDAMLSERPYSKAMTIEDAFSNLKSEAGRHFDPELVDIFIKTIQSEKLWKNYAMMGAVG